MTRTGVRVGVDVGSVRVGLAASDPSGLLATPVRTVARDADTPAPDSGAGVPADIEEVAAFVAEASALEVVVGLPRTLAGDEGPAAVLARQYARRLAVRVAPVPVRLVDERLTTVDAHRSLRESGVAGRRQRAVVDQAAAVLILQAALDAERGSGRPPGELVRPDGRKPRTKDRRR
ncbi:putative holliday junction resolvase [Pedococcus cremeus]|uniref:Putative pre-16S rRNA nuclease n=1 Tax=Pedococcus cremeus TaxID=587636 RepID=A0A1H9X3Y1_9MICO|nr:Holliday junction resolvase RuvX [Pedococcus cremeus]SES40741.1 putative holliday junction resolvase [Pedococcus cremeus]